MSAPEATEVTAPSGFVHVGWRWKTQYAADWSTAYSIEKPVLGFTPAYADKITWEPLFGISQVPDKAPDDELPLSRAKLMNKNTVGTSGLP